MALELYHPGLRGVVAGETEISSLDGGLRYRGYCIYDLSDGASFLEVAFLLLHEMLPGEEELADFLSVLAEEAVLPAELAAVHELLPIHVSRLEWLRTGIGLLSDFDPQPDDPLLDAGPSQVVRLLARIPLLLAMGAPARRQAGQGASSPPRPGVAAAENRVNRNADGPASPSASKSTPRFAACSSYADYLLRLLKGAAPAEHAERALEVALIVAAEHEFTPSSFAARLAGSTHSSIYSAVLAALSTFTGVRHSTVERSVLDVLDDVGSPEAAADWVAARTAAKEGIPGFGHPVFAECDPRAAILDGWCHTLAESHGRQDRELLAEAVEHAVWDQQKLPPNLDWSFARLLEHLGFERDLHLPLFACARTVGWCAHALEQAASGETIRPRARYRGADRVPFEPLWRRLG